MPPSLSSLHKGEGMRIGSARKGEIGIRAASLWTIHNSCNAILRLVNRGFRTPSSFRSDLCASVFNHPIRSASVPSQPIHCELLFIMSGIEQGHAHGWSKGHGDGR